MIIRNELLYRAEPVAAGSKAAASYRQIAILAAIYLGSYLFIMWTTEKVFLTEAAYRNSFGGIASQQDITYLIHKASQYRAWTYTLTIFLQALKLVAVSIIVYTAAYLFGFKLSGRLVLKCAVLAEFVLIIPYVWRFLVFYDPGGCGTDLIAMQAYWPLSLHSVVGENASAGWTYTLQSVNLFELLYCLGFAYLLHLYRLNSYDLALKIVLAGYLPAKVFWIVCTVFLAQTGIL